MIAIPVKTDKKNPVVSTLFGKSKYFAFIDNNQNITIEKNEKTSGRKLVESFIEKGVDTLIFHHMGANPFILLQSKNINCYHDGGERIFLDEILEKLKNSKLAKVDVTNMSNYIEKGNMYKTEAKKHHH